MLHILVIPAFRLYPLDSGGAYAQLVFLEKQQHQQQIDLFITPENINAEDINAFQEKFPKINLIQAGFEATNVVDKSTSFLKKLKRKISGKDYAYQLKKSRYLNGLIQMRPEMMEEVQRIAALKEYDIIQVEHSINMGLIGLLPSKPSKIFVHHEIAHTRIHSDMLSIGHSNTFSSYISGIASQLELSWLNQYDGVITLCTEDAELLQQKGVDVPIHIGRSFALFENELSNNYNPDLPPQLLFVGGESHYPNKEGLKWFLDEVFPLIQAKSQECSIKITGNWSQEFKNKYENNHVVQFTGFVKNLDEVYKDSILVTPIRIGSGIRIKAITGLAHGVPVVSTSLGISGIPGLADNENVMIADKPDGFASKVVLLLNNPALRKKISDQCFQLAKNEYNNAGFVEERNAFYGHLLNQ